MEGDTRDIYGAIEMLCVLIEMVAKQVYSFVNTQQIVHVYILLPVNYTSLKLF